MIFIGLENSPRHTHWMKTIFNIISRRCIVCWPSNGSSSHTQMIYTKTKWKWSLVVCGGGGSDGGIIQIAIKWRDECEWCTRIRICTPAHNGRQIDANRIKVFYRWTKQREKYQQQQKSTKVHSYIITVLYIIVSNGI